MSTTTEETPSTSEKQSEPRKFQFPSAVTLLAIVAILVWVITIFIPAGSYKLDENGSPVPGSFHYVHSTLSVGERFKQILFAPINGLYGVQDTSTGFVDPDNVGALFGSIGVIFFIMCLGAFISVAFATRALEVAITQLTARIQSRGSLLIIVIMALFSLLGTTMGFSVETFGFYVLLIPLMAALGYDRMTTAAMIILGSSIGTMASTVNPFSIGVASGEAGVSIGDGIVLRVVVWAVLTVLGILFVLRYAARVRARPELSLLAGEPDPDEASADESTDAQPEHAAATADRLTGVQKFALVITGLTFALLIFSVIPWSAIFGGSTAQAEYDELHEVATKPYWFELNWWFPELSLLFLIAALIIGLVARMGEKRIVSLITQGAADMIGPAVVILLARGVAVLMTNTQTLDTVLHAMENLVSGTSTGVFLILVTLVNMPLAFLIPSSSGHATLAMPLLAPLADLADVSRSLVITAFQLGHGLMLTFAPTNVIIVGGLAIAKVGYSKYLRFVWPLLVAFFVVIAVALLVGSLAS
jgi:uncharacterized ion transporter superfamily protein YfcC